jgi:hypothetical protein
MGRMRAPVARSSSVHSSTRVWIVGTSSWVNMLKTSGRPERRLVSAMRATSRRTSGYLVVVSRSPNPATHCTIPRPRSPSAAARASSSESGAKVPGMGSPSGVVWLRVREVEKPSAPPRTASSTHARMRWSSASLGARSSSTLEGPMAWKRRAAWPTSPPTFTPRGCAPSASRYSP